MANYTKTEKEFQELHKELLNKKLYDLACKFSSVFYRYGTECHKQGIEFMKELNQ